MEEEQRLAEPPAAGWKVWGPYLSERQWGTVREDYSSGGSAWDAFTHDEARSRAYRWGEDGILGISELRGMLRGDLRGIGSSRSRDARSRTRSRTPWPWPAASA